MGLGQTESEGPCDVGIEPHFGETVDSRDLGVGVVEEDLERRSFSQSSE